MQPTSLSLTARTLHAELRELALAIGTTENIGLAPGTVVAKTVRGNVYLYFHNPHLDGHTGQAYLGPESVTTRDVLHLIEGRALDRAADLTRLKGAGLS